MGACTKTYIFKKITKDDFLQAVSQIPYAKNLEHSLEYDKNLGIWSGYVGFKYKGVYRNMYVLIRENTDEYVRIFNNHNGENDIIPNIKNYGESQYVIETSLGLDRLSIEFSTLVLKILGGVLRRNDCSSAPLEYIKGVIEEKVIYPNLKAVPNVVLTGFVTDYLKNSDITKINSRLKTKIKGMDLLKEFAIRNI